MKDEADSTAERIVQILRERDGVATEVQLTGKRVCTVYNIAWGRDLGNPHYHITTNISPEPPGPHTIDFFFTHEVASIRAPGAAQESLIFSKP
ncbi:MAG: hypothetical protein ACJ75H_18040 [Thermoanaerobaculia bacterium]